MRYDFVGRLETLQDDFASVMASLKLSDTDKLLWEQVSSKSRPVRPIGGVDRTLRLQHYYQSDDAHDLIGLVQHVYREDLRRFGYSYPGNGTTTPTWQRREVLSSHQRVPR